MDDATHSALHAVLYDEFDSFVTGHSEARAKANGALSRIVQLLDSSKKSPAIHVRVTATTPAGISRDVTRVVKLDGFGRDDLNCDTLYVAVSLTRDEVLHLAGHAPTSAQSFHRDAARSELLALLESDEVLDEESAHVLWKTLWRWARKPRT